MFLVSCVSIIAASCLFLFVFQIFYNNIKIGNIRDNTILIKHSIQKKYNYDFFDDVNLKDVGITIFDSNGSVLFESEENIYNENINNSDYLKALEIGVSDSKVYSKEKARHIYYYFVRLSSDRVLCLSTPLFNVIDIFNNNRLEISIVVLFSILISYFISRIIARKFSVFIKSLTKNLDNIDIREYYDELYPFVKKIQSQKDIIKYQLETFNQERDRADIITEHMQEGLIILDNNQTVISINSSAKSILKVDNENFFGRHILEVTRNHKINQAVYNVYAQDIVDSILEQDNKFYKIHGCHVKYQGQNIGAILLFVDITLSELETSRRKEFTANVSHELKTPLTSILGYSELIYNNVVKDIDRTVFISKIIHESKRMMSLIEDIMVLSKLDERNYTKDLEEISIKSIVYEVFNRLEKQSSEKNIKLSFIGDDIVFKSSIYMLNQIIFNLVDNAIKYNKINGTVDVCCNAIGNNLEIVVKDSGLGIEISEIDRIFERFYRVEKSRNKFTGGTGLGLSIVKNMVLKLNGEIKISSIPDNGTQITIILYVEQNS